MIRKTMMLCIVILAMLLVATPSWSALDVPVLDQDIITNITGDNYICGPTVTTEIMGFWAKNGYPKLMTGLPSGAVPDTSQQVLDLFDVMEYYTGYNGMYTYEEPLRSGIEKYFYDKGYEAEVVMTKTGAVYWADLVKELDAGRPVIMLAYNWSHWFVITGYTTYPTKTLTLLWGHAPLVRKYDLSYFTPSQCRAIYIRPKAPPPVEIVPYDEPWYPDAKVWCDANGWVIQKTQ